MGWVRVSIKPTDPPWLRQQLAELNREADRRDPLTRSDIVQDRRERREEDWADDNFDRM